MITHKLSRLARSRKKPYYLVRNAKIIEKAESGWKVSDIAKIVDMTPSRIREIQHRYYTQGLPGLYDRKPITYKGRLKVEVKQQAPREVSNTKRTSKANFVLTDSLLCFSDGSNRHEVLVMGLTGTKTG